MLETILSSLRSKGWVIAVHNDYKLNGKLMTFYLFTNGSLCAKGEAETDAEALNQVVEAISKTEREYAQMCEALGTLAQSTNHSG